MTSQLTTMAQALAHRGPDHQGCWVADDARVGLAHRRLSIIDLSPAGRQPMSSPGGRFQLSFNGEIYNYIELREQLVREGQAFRTASDTEVLLAAFERWGVARTLGQVAGMFAFALWDTVDHRLTLVRDRAGKKPMYFARAGDSVFAASEMKALLAVGFGEALDRESLHHYLSLGYVPGPRTIYRDIQEVPAGSVMSIDSELGTRTDAYWTLPAPREQPVTFDVAVAETEQRLREAVRIRLRADVPVGVFLSGGIDSGLLVAMAAQEASKPVRTFTIAFGEQRFDESAFARTVADRYGTAHSRIEVSPALDTLVPRIASAYDEPFADSSAIPTFAVAEAAARELRVVLNGEGADELFAGYRRAWAARHHARFRIVPAGLARALHNGLPRPRGFRTPYSLAYRFLGGLSEGLGERFVTWGTDGFSEPEKRQLCRDGVSPDWSTPQLLESRALPGAASLAQFMGLDFTVGMTDCLLVKMDIATMAHSLEARCPFLDHHVVEWAASLPRSVVFRGGETKPILRAIARELLPPPIADLPKRGFEIPLADWVDGRLAPLVRDSLTASRGVVADMLEPRGVRALLDPVGLVDRERRAKHLWILTMLAQWDAMRTQGSAEPLP